MTTFPTPGYLADALRTQSEQKVALEAFLAATRQLPGAGGAVGTLTIASGSISPTAGAHVVGTEGAAVADDLANIAQTNLPDGSLLFLSALSSLQVVILKHGAGGAGQLALADAADLSLVDPTMVVILRRMGALWAEVGRYYGNQGPAFRARYDLPSLATVPNTFTKTQHWAQGANIASAATLTLGTDGNRFLVTGVLGITAISAKPVGTRVVLGFTGTASLTHHASNLQLQNGETFSATPGDELEVVSIGSGQWKEINRHLVTATLGFQGNPETQVETVWDDFYGTSDGVIFTSTPGTGGGLWTTPNASGFSIVASFRGIVRLVGDGVTGPTVGGGVAAYTAAEFPELYVRWAQFGGATATRRIGLTGGALNGDPVNGIYFRHSAAGNIIAVCRAAASESTLDTGIPTADGVFHTGRLLITPTLVSVYVDGALKGTISATIPTASLSAGFGSNAISSALGLEVDYIVGKRRR